MIEKRTNMLDAGTVRFRTEKPFGTVLGGLKTEMQRYGTVLRADEADPDRLPPTCGPCDLFLDASTPFRTRYIAATVEDAGPAGETPDGESVRWYAVTFKEGNRNPLLRTRPALAAALCIAAGLPTAAASLPRILTVPAGLALAATCLYALLSPSRKAERTVARLKDAVRQGK